MTRKSYLVGLLITLLAFAAPQSWAREVTETEVRTAAENLLASGRLQQAFPNATIREVIDAGEIWYIQLNPSGHLILSGSTRAIPLLGYAACDYQPMPANHPLHAIYSSMRGRVKINETATTASTFSSLNTPSNDAETQWANLLNPSVSLFSDTNSETQVGPLLETAWNQCAPWNDLTPQASAMSNLAKLSPGEPVYYGRIAIGCVVTAYTQIMRYHAWPVYVDEGFAEELEVANGPLTDVNYVYTPLPEGSNDEPPPYSKTNYRMQFHGGNPIDWGNIFATYDANNLVESQRLPVARLGLLADILADMHFDGLTGSGTQTVIPASNNPWYTLGNYLSWEWDANGTVAEDEDGNSYVSYLTPERADACKASLDKKLPILVSLQEPAHAIVMDGYKVDSDENLYFHLNYGWGGASNDHYQLYVSQDSVQYVGLVVDHHPKQMAQLQALPEKINPGDDGHNLHFVVPNCWKNSFSRFSIRSTQYDMESVSTTPWKAATSEKEFTPDANTDTIQSAKITLTDENGIGTKKDGFIVQNPSELNNFAHYTFSEPFIPTEDSELTFGYTSCDNKSQIVELQIWTEESPCWETLITLTEQETPKDETPTPVVYTPDPIALKQYADSFCRLRLHYTITMPEDESEDAEDDNQESEGSSLPLYCIYDLQVSNVREKAASTPTTIMNDVLEEGQKTTTFSVGISDTLPEGRYWFSLTAMANSDEPYLDAPLSDDEAAEAETITCVTSSAFTTLVKTETVTIPTIEDVSPTIPGITLTGEATLSGPLFGTTQFSVTCSDDVIELSVQSACPTLIPDSSAKDTEDEGESEGTEGGTTEDEGTEAASEGEGESEGTEGGATEGEGESEGTEGGATEGEGESEGTEGEGTDGGTTEVITVVKDENTSVFTVTITPQLHKFPTKSGAKITTGQVIADTYEGYTSSAEPFKSVEDFDGTRVLLTLTATNQFGNEVHRDLVLELRSGNYVVIDVPVGDLSGTNSGSSEENTTEGEGSGDGTEEETGDGTEEETGDGTEEETGDGAEEETGDDTGDGSTEGEGENTTEDEGTTTPTSIAIEIPYSWFQANGLWNDNWDELSAEERQAAVTAVAKGDSDEDGYLDYEEYLCKTNPNDSGSHLRITNILFQTDEDGALVKNEDGSLVFAGVQTEPDLNASAPALVTIRLQGKATLEPSNTWNFTRGDDGQLNPAINEYRFFRLLAIPSFGKSTNY